MLRSSWKLNEFYYIHLRNRVACIMIRGCGGGAKLSCPLHAPHNNFKVSKLQSRPLQQFHYLRSPYCRQWKECDVLVSLLYSVVVVDVTSRSSTITLLQTLEFFFHPYSTSRNSCFFFLTCFKCFAMFEAPVSQVSLL